MKTKMYSTLQRAMLALSTTCFLAGTAEASDSYTPVSMFSPAPSGMMDPDGPTFATGKEYSHGVPFAGAPSGDHDADTVIDPLQTVLWDGIGGAIDGVDYGDLPGLPTSVPPDQLQVDAMANHRDHLFGNITNFAPFATGGPDTTALLFSVTDPAGSKGLNVYRENGMTGATGLWADGESAPPAQEINDHGVDMVTPDNWQNLDALEVWGPEASSDADRFSLEGDKMLTTSVWTTTTGAVTPYISQMELSTAVAGLLGITDPMDIGFFVDNADVDVDALIAADDGDTMGGGSVHVWDDLDEIIFSLHPFTITLPTFGVVGMDGGEVIDWLKGSGITFLTHGGHLWDTAFDVTAAVDPMAPMGSLENVDALEAMGKGIPIPEPGTYVLLGAMLAAVGLQRRRAVCNS